MISRKNPLYTLLFLLLGVGVIACDNPVDHDEDEHAEADGLRVLLDGAVVYRVLDGDVSCPNEPCVIVVAEGEETALFTVEFLTADGDEIHDEDLDEDFSLGFEMADPAIAEFEQDGTWSLRVVGKQVGETKAQLHLLHVGHPDFSTPPPALQNGQPNPNALTIRVAQD